MGFFNRLFGKKESGSDAKDGGSLKIAFVLLAEPQLPQPDAIVEAFAEFATAGASLELGEGNATEGANKQVITLALNTGENMFVALMPAAVPNDEADHAARYSLSSFRNDWTLPPHSAHLLVTFHGGSNTPVIEGLSRFTSVIAAVTKASDAVGVYWGDAGATHDSEFFTSIAAEEDVVAKLMLWSGVSIAREEDGRLSFLSLGMEQLNLPDLLLVAGESSANVAVETMYDLLAYVAQRGEALPDGDTIGRSDDQRLPVRYVKSPLDAKKKVWRVELP